MSKPKKLEQKNGITARQKMLKTFPIDYTSEVDDVRYKGNFTTKRMSIADLATLGVRKAQLNGGMHHDPDNPGHGVDEHTDNFNSMISHLELALVEVPQWWDLEKITDHDLISLVFEEVTKHEHSFLRSKDDDDTIGSGDEDVGSGESLGEGDQTQAKTGGTAGQVVDEEVHAALEP
jgi:hypothetical protein